MLAKFSKEDTANRKKSGTEEEHDRLGELLTEVDAFIKSAEKEKVKKRQVKCQKETLQKEVTKRFRVLGENTGHQVDEIAAEGDHLSEKNTLNQESFLLPTMFICWQALAKKRVLKWHALRPLNR